MPPTASPAPLLSVIVPTYNVQALIGPCLDQLSNQTRTDFEVLVIDGASSDDTVTEVSRRALADPRIRLLSEPDRGIYDAMNKGVALARGEWLIFLGADDALFDEHSLAQLAPHLLPTLDLVYGDVFNLRAQRRMGGAFSVARLLVETIPHQAMAFRRDFLEGLGPFDLAFPIAADWDMNLRAFAAGARSRYTDQVISRYSGTGISARQVDEPFEYARHARIAKYWGVSQWHPRLRACRFAYRVAASEAWARREPLRAAADLARYAWHSLGARLGRPDLWS